MEKYCVGIDIDKKTFKICLTLRDIELKKKTKGSKTFANTPEGFAEFSKWLSKNIRLEDTPESYVMEATGVYHEALAYYLHDLGKTVYIILPLKAKRYLQSLGIRSKTDQIDAKGLSIMGCEQELETWKPGSKELLYLRSVTRQIEALKNHKTSFKNQLEGAKHTVVIDSVVIKSLLAMIKELDKQILKLEEKVKEIINSSSVLKEKFKLFEPLKGIGIMSFAVVISETNGFALFKNQRQLVSYVGYDIVQNQSGQRAGKTRISKKGNSHIRRILHMSSLTAVAHVPVYQKLYERIYDRAEIKMKGYVAVQRKLLVLIYTLWKNDTVFDPAF